MNELIKNKNGITLMALVITIIVLLILASISIGTISQISKNTKQARADILKSDLFKIQQAVMETYTKYKQLGNKDILVGTELSYEEVQTEFGNLIDSLKVSQYNLEDTNVDAEKYYRKLDKETLTNLGLININTDDEFIVNYSSGEVFNITQKRTDTGEILYIYAKNENNETMADP